MEALELAGLLTTRTAGNERRVFLASNGPILPGLRPPVPQPDWVTRFRVSLEALRFARRDGMSNTVRAIEARTLVEPLLDSIASEGMPKLNLSALGEESAPAFDRWASELGHWLRLPARG